MTQFQREIAIVSMLLVFSYASFYCVGTVHTDYIAKKEAVQEKGNAVNESRKSLSFTGCIGF